jgi:hypothetical protein
MVKLVNVVPSSVYFTGIIGGAVVAIIKENRVMTGNPASGRFTPN